MSGLLPWAALALPPVAILAIALFNLAAWPRGRGDARPAGRVAVLIPARNEERAIGRAVRAALACEPPADELLVYDDNSVDGTAAIVRDLAASDHRVRLLAAEPLPVGWVGKPWACARLAAATEADTLLFVDADVEMERDAIGRVASLFQDFRAELVTLGLRQRAGTVGEQLVIPLLHLSYLAWLPLPLVWRSRDPRFLVANGQLLAVTRAAYRAAGGWAAVRDEIVDDMAFARRVKLGGDRVVFADGFATARTRMYHGFGELWRGFSKNLYEGVGGRPAGVAVVVAVHLWIFVLPYLALAGALMGLGVPLAPAAVGVAANLALRAAFAARFRQPAWGIFAHPVAVLVLVAIALNSWRWSQRGAIRWRGRVYAAAGARRERAAAAGGAK